MKLRFSIRDLLWLTLVVALTNRSALVENFQNPVHVIIQVPRQRKQPIQICQLRVGVKYREEFRAFDARRDVDTIVAIASLDRCQAQPKLETITGGYH